MISVILYVLEALLALGLAIIMPSLGGLLLGFLFIRLALRAWYNFRASGVEDSDFRIKGKEAQAKIQKKRDYLLMSITGAPMMLLLWNAALMSLYFLYLNYGLEPSETAEWLEKAAGITIATAHIYPMAGDAIEAMADSENPQLGLLLAHMLGLSFWVLIASIYGQVQLVVQLLRYKDKYEAAKYSVRGILLSQMFLGILGLVAYIALGIKGNEALALGLADSVFWVLIIGGLVPLLPGFITSAALGRVVSVVTEPEDNDDDW